MSNLVELELAPNEKRCSKCKEVKDRGEYHSRKRNKDSLSYYCKECDYEVTRKSLDKRRARKDKTCIACPVCGEKFSFLITHIKRVHELVYKDLDKSDLNPYISLKVRESRKEVGLSRRKGDFAELNSNHISIPEKFWSLDCHYVKVKVMKEMRQIHFNPINIKLPGTKAVNVRTQEGRHRIKIHLHSEILDIIEMFRPVYELRGSAGFYIQFYEQDDRLLEPFEYWAKSGQSMKNVAGLTTFSYLKSPTISISNHLWPQNAEYAYFEWVKPKRKGYGYLDVLPVSRTGFIVGGKKLNFKQYIGLEESRKLVPAKTRLIMSASVFIHENNIPSGDWDLVKVLPSGALRFRMYQERQPKEQLEEIAG